MAKLNAVATAEESADKIAHLMKEIAGLDTFAIYRLGDNDFGLWQKYYASMQ